jgi:hypothetical protein
MRTKHYQYSSRAEGVLTGPEPSLYILNHVAFNRKRFPRKRFPLIAESISPKVKPRLKSIIGFGV